MANLYFRYGAMNCGKTTILLQVAHNYEERGMKILLLKPSIDKKGDLNVVSRLGIERKVDYLLNPNENTINELNLDGISCILVDEAQFLNEKQVEDLWMIAKLKDVPVICYGLKTNFKSKLFEGSATLFALSDKIEELATICSCGKKARFNARVVNGKYTTDGKEVAIDGLDAKYESLCAKCYIKKVLKK